MVPTLPPRLTVSVASVSYRQQDCSFFFYLSLIHLKHVVLSFCLSASEKILNMPPDSSLYGFLAIILLSDFPSKFSNLDTNDSNFESSSEEKH